MKSKGNIQWIQAEWMGGHYVYSAYFEKTKQNKKSRVVLVQVYFWYVTIFTVYWPAGRSLSQSRHISLLESNMVSPIRRLSTTDVPRGLVVRIRRSHRRGPGSIPGVGIGLFFFLFLFLKYSPLAKKNWYLKIYIWTRGFMFDFFIIIQDGNDTLLSKWRWRRRWNSFCGGRQLYSEWVGKCL